MSPPPAIFSSFLIIAAPFQRVPHLRHRVFDFAASPGRRRWAPCRKIRRPGGTPLAQKRGREDLNDRLGSAAFSIESQSTSDGKKKPQPPRMKPGGRSFGAHHQGERTTASRR
jgi:hypothetical protein